MLEIGEKHDEIFSHLGWHQKAADMKIGASILKNV